MEEKKNRQNIRASEMEKSDILGNYRNVCNENERLDKNMGDLTNENQILFQKVKHYEKECEALKSHLGIFE